ncbi:MAG: thioredoxin [Bacteroidales bacterium]|jgi:thioredoxin|nr:thioredoxin [Bacteroidales bacterium]
MIEHLTAETFKEKVFDYVNEKEWKYKGDKPAIIDFYADWCSPCKMLAPILEEIDAEYNDKIQIYKINTEEEQELSYAFGIQSIPSILFIPLDDQPRMAVGALPKNNLEEIIKDVLKVEK